MNLLEIGLLAPTPVMGVGGNSQSLIQGSGKEEGMITRGMQRGARETSSPLRLDFS
jgi:hypothetical protein